jgi:TonB family protein
MKTSMNIPLSALAAVLTFSVGCNGQPQPESLAGTPTTSTAAVALDLGLSTYLRGTPTQIFYDLDSRFLLTVTKDQLRAAKTIHDIVPEHLGQEGVSYSSVSIRTVERKGGTEIVASGTDQVLDAEQRKFLWSLDYSDSFVIHAWSRPNNGAAVTTSDNHFTPHVTIVPEHEAVNSLGKEAMIAHVQNGTSAFAYLVDAQTLRSGKVHFTVDKAGMVSDVRLSESSGYPALDARVLELLNTLPGTWSAASNAAGEAVEQEFVFSFGTVGC